MKVLVWAGKTTISPKEPISSLRIHLTFFKIFKRFYPLI